MAKQKAVLEKKKVAAPALPPKKTVELWCDVCHTKWTEGVLAAWTKCPFVDCKGTLRTEPIVPPRKPVRYIKDKTMPLVAAMEAGDDVA